MSGLKFWQVLRPIMPCRVVVGSHHRFNTKEKKMEKEGKILLRGLVPEFA